MNVRRLNKGTMIYLSVITFFVLILFSPVYKHLWGRFTASDSYYSHGFLIPLISFFLIWRKREKLRMLPVESCMAGLFLMIGGIVLYIVSLVLKVNFGAYFSIPITIFGIILYLGGKKIAKELFFPVCFLVFMLPLPKVCIIAVTFKLKTAVADWAAFAVSGMGIEAERIGSKIYYPGGFLLVGAPCSGLRSLISFLALGAVFTQVTEAASWKKVLLFLLTVPIALFSNFLRVTFLVIISYIYGEEVATGRLHDLSGVIVFIVGFLCFFGVIKLLKCQAETKNI